MTLWEAIILGIVQGLTEFLPISSSAHLRIVGEFTSESDPGAAFTAITQIGTEAAVLLYFRHDIARIISHWFRALPVGPWKRQLPPSDPDARLGWLVILGSIPIGVGGLLLEDWIDTTFRNLYITVATLALFGILLGVADSVSRRVRTLDEMTYPHGIIYGFAQAMALIPGVSRSGGTITAGRFMGYTRQAAARYSFLLAIPAVLASGFYKLFGDVLLGSDESVEAEPAMTAIIVATIVAFAVGYLVIVAFLKIISRYSFMPFVIYRLILAGVVFYMLQNNIISAV